MALLLWLWSLGAKVDFEDPCQESQAFRQPMKAHTFVGLRLGPLGPIAASPPVACIPRSGRCLSESG